MAVNVQLGDKVKDRISGLQGIVVVVSDSLHGCRQIAVRPQELKDGKPVEASWFDIDQVELVEAGVIKPKVDPATRTAFPGGTSLHGHPRA